MKNKKEIDYLEERNSELAKEILLNEVAIYEVEKEFSKLKGFLTDSTTVQKQIGQAKLLIEIIEAKNLIYKNEIFENEVRIKNLSDEN